MIFSPKIKTSNTFTNIAPTYALGGKNTGSLRLIRKNLIKSAIVVEINDAANNPKQAHVEGKSPPKIVST